MPVKFQRDDRYMSESENAAEDPRESEPQQHDDIQESELLAVQSDPDPSGLRLLTSIPLATPTHPTNKLPLSISKTSRNTFFFFFIILAVNFAIYYNSLQVTCCNNQKEIHHFSLHLTPISSRMNSHSTTTSELCIIPT